MEGKTPAPWFVEVNGQKQGPYTSQQIMKLVMDGNLDVQSRVFDAASGTWKIAADAISRLEQPSKDWHPPPRPSELRDVHVVALNAESTGAIDYFALISERKKELEKKQALSRPAHERDASPRAADNQRHRLASASRDQTNYVPSPPSHKAEPKPLGDSAGAETRGGVLLIFKKTLSTANKNRDGFSIAAGLALVFLGTFGVIKTWSTRSGREPAAANKQTDQATSQGSTALDKVAISSPLSSESSLGSGKNKIKRPSGSAAISSYPPRPFQQMVAPMTAPLSQPAFIPPSQDPVREPPQFYSTAESNGSSVTTESPPIPPPPGIPPPPMNGAMNGSGFANDPTAGPVDPPAYIPPPSAPAIPPAGIDPNNPDRIPSSDPANGSP